MGIVKFEVPDGRWFGGDYQHRPEDKSFCVIMVDDDTFPEIGLYLEKADMFLRVNVLDFARKSNKQYFLYRTHVKRWKLIDLPTAIEGNLFSKVEKWEI